MYKILLVIALICSFASCKKKCSERIYPTQVCAEADTALAYQLIVGKWYLRREFHGGPLPGPGDKDDDFKCYGLIPEPVLEVFPDSMLFKYPGVPRTLQYFLAPDSSPYPHLLIYYNGSASGADIGVCDNLLTISDNYPGSFNSYSYTKE